MTQNEQKVLVANTAVDKLLEEGKIFDGMKIGLGTGSTAMPAVKRLAEHIQNGKVKDVKAVVTSFQTAVACQELGIPVYTLNDKIIGGQLDLAIDGADEVDDDCNCIKGGGAAHLREKLVEYNSKIFVVIGDSSKAVKTIGTQFRVPVEIIGDARVPVTQALNKLGADCVLREGVKKAGPVITDNGNMILDCHWESPINVAEMEDKINQIVGVVENGLFSKNKPIVFIAQDDGTVDIKNWH
ncbi:MAG: ribose-5-phosphate isomerase RpiA [Treponema sp.]|jgi:ribose 5-phosphate isomerase A|nr:ribose-5-phosphate isomerase RpiA [Treponema bryantii]MBO5117102.1 ribose-5-phosphate isomerase RpiA [Treponema sp.]MBO5483139.1 ribose-5-phosphate isomerase RpiA [Spirochaetaceae bacterium]MBQ8211648.1 ribose-5-phosphate isomerase RpiA [Treponema sp.]MBQ8776538.1 ribose-5-phosphate isomerase RpiA [Treponema sp.]